MAWDKEAWVSLLRCCPRDPALDKSQNCTRKLLILLKKRKNTSESEYSMKSVNVRDITLVSRVAEGIVDQV